MTQSNTNLDFEYKFGFSMKENYTFKAEKGLNEAVVRNISKIKGEPEWMTNFRLKSYKIFLEKKMPTWGADLSKIDFDESIEMTFDWYKKYYDNKNDIINLTNSQINRYFG